MKNILFLLLLFPALLYAQYPNNPRKLRLGYQTTGAGLVYIQSGAPAHTPGDDEDAWMVLDTSNNILYYWDETAGAWENILNDFTRDTVFMITNVPDTAALVPIQGDAFINSTADTLGLYDGGQWRLFFGGSGGGSTEVADGLTILGDGSGGSPFRVNTDSLHTYQVSFDIQSPALIPCGETSDNFTWLGKVVDDSIRVGMNISSLIDEVNEAGIGIVGTTEFDGYATLQMNGTLSAGSYLPEVVYKGYTLWSEVVVVEVQDCATTISFAGDSGTPIARTDGETLTIAGAGIAATSTSGTTVTVTATEVDGSITNEKDTVSTLLQDSIIVYSVSGVETGRDTIRTPGGGSGTVTSVALSLPSQFAVTGSPVTSSGTLAGSWNSQAANTILAGPVSGGAASPTFRSLVAADISGTITADSLERQAFYDYDIEEMCDSFSLHGRDGAASFQLDDYLYVIGGWHPDSTPTTNSEVYRAHVDSLCTWTQLSDAPWFRRHTFGCEVIGDSVYVWGGDYYSGASAHDAWVGWVSGDTLAWAETNGTLPYNQRILAGYTAQDGYLYTVGGQYSVNDTTTTDTRDVWRSGDGGRNWTQMASGSALWWANRNLDGCVVSYNGSLYALGGAEYMLTNFYEPDCWRSDDNGATWYRVADLIIRPTQYPKSVVFDGKIFRTMGGWYGVPGLQQILYFDGKKWRQIYNESVLGRHAHSGNVITKTDGTQSMVFAGGTASTGAALNQIIEIRRNGGYRNVTEGDETRLRLAIIDSLVTTPKLNSPATLDINGVNAFSQNGWLGIRTITPTTKLDLVGVNMRVGADETGSGTGFAGYEGDTRGTNTNKMFRFYAPSYSNPSAKIGLLSYYSTVSGSTVHFGGSTGVALTNPNLMRFYVSGESDPMLEMNSTNVTSNNSGMSSFWRIRGLGDGTANIFGIQDLSGDHRFKVQEDGKVMINSDSAPSRTLHVTGEVRITDLTTDTPTRIVGADADGDLGEMTAGTGISFAGGQVSSTVDLGDVGTNLSADDVPVWDGAELQPSLITTDGFGTIYLTEDFPFLGLWNGAPGAANDGYVLVYSDADGGIVLSEPPFLQLSMDEDEEVVLNGNILYLNSSAAVGLTIDDANGMVIIGMGTDAPTSTSAQMVFDNSDDSSTWGQTGTNAFFEIPAIGGARINSNSIGVRAEWDDTDPLVTFYDDEIFLPNIADASAVQPYNVVMTADGELRKDTVYAPVYGYLYGAPLDSIDVAGATDQKSITGWTDGGYNSGHWTYTDSSMVYAGPTHRCEIRLSAKLIGGAAGDVELRIGYSTTAGGGTLVLPADQQRRITLSGGSTRQDFYTSCIIQVAAGYEIKARGARGDFGIREARLVAQQID